MYIALLKSHGYFIINLNQIQNSISKFMVAYFSPLDTSYFSISHVYMQDQYVDMQGNYMYVNMQHIYVEVQEKGNEIRISELLKNYPTSPTLTPNMLDTTYLC